MTTRNPTLPIAELKCSSENDELLSSMEQLYRELDADIARQPGQCWIKSACCKFDWQDGHRLFVTAIEVCYYLAHQSPPPADGDRCPHLVGGLCGVRDVRPVGCRIYYCDPAAQHWQGLMTEAYLARLRTMHVQFDVPYFYVDWLTVLEAIRAHDRVEQVAPTRTEPRS